VDMLPAASALDNRPLTLTNFDHDNQLVYVFGDTGPMKCQSAGVVVRI